MSSHTKQLRPLILGVDWAMSKRAIILAGGLFVTTFTFRYLLFLSIFQNSGLWLVARVLQVKGYLPTMYATGMFIVFGLAALHAYLNEGYLPSVVLGWSPIFGFDGWSIYSLADFSDVRPDLLSAFERGFPEAVVIATLGFILGLGFRMVKRTEATSQV